MIFQSLAKHTRGRFGEEGGPPPWIPFGQKIVRPNIQDRNFKVRKKFFFYFLHFSCIMIFSPIFLNALLGFIINSLLIKFLSKF